MKRLLLSLLILGLLGVAPGLTSHFHSSPVVEAAADRFMIIDVACDGRTFRLNRLDPAATAFARGDTFIVDGTIYPGGTIPAGGTRENPVFSPDEPGSIGKWICRGTFMVSSAQIAAGVVPHFASTQFYTLNDGSSLVSEGVEGGITTVRAVPGGTGDFIGGFMGARGEVTEEILGRNSTGLFNFRFTFKLRRGRYDITAPDRR